MTDKEIINIAIADDHAMVRKGIIDYIVFFKNFNIIIEASDGRDLIEQLHKATTLPDICILDISMPQLNGYKTLKEIRRNWQSIKVLVFSAFYNEFSIAEMLGNGANGFLRKDCTPMQLQQALASIYYNDFYLTETASREFFNRQQKSRFSPRITDREMEFLCHCCSELHYKEIAGLMNVSSRTVEAFRDSLFAKFNIKTRAGLVMFALQNGIVYLEKQLREN